MKTKTAPTAVEHRSLHDFPEYVEQEQKLAELENERRQSQATLDEEWQRVEALKSQNYLPQPGPILQKAVDKLDGATERERRPNVTELNEQVSVLNAAIVIQRQRLATVRSKVGRAIRADFLDEHRKVKVRLQAAGEQLLAAFQDEERIRDEILRCGAEWGTPLESLTSLKVYRTHGDSDGMLANWLREIEQAYK